MKILSWDIGMYNLSYCIIERKETESGMRDEIVDWNIVNLIEDEEMKKNKIRLFENIPRKLQEYPQLLDVDVVVIENQPSLKNPLMKSIQMIVYSYFLIVGKIVGGGKEDEQYYIERIEFCSASNKLKNICKTKMNYNEKKKMAVEYTASYLKEKGDEKNSHFFASHKKKDDLADSLLQGLYYLDKMM
jgi:hypothetical protein